MLDGWLLEVKEDINRALEAHEYKVLEISYACLADPFATREIHFSLSLLKNRDKDITVYIPYNKPLTCEYILSELLIILGLKVGELKYIKLSTAHVPGPYPVWGNLIANNVATGWIVVAVDSDFTHENVPEWFKSIHHYCISNEIDAIYFDRNGRKMINLFPTWDW